MNLRMEKLRERLEELLERLPGEKETPQENLQ
jgi:hypothetical protein